MTTAAEEGNGASDVTRARENPPSRKPAEHYWVDVVNLTKALMWRVQEATGLAIEAEVEWVN
jgi:hypothetical protein